MSLKVSNVSISEEPWALLPALLMSIKILKPHPNLTACSLHLEMNLLLCSLHACLF